MSTGTISLPTYEEAAPDPELPFALFDQGRPVYPYALRKNFTNNRVPKTWRTLDLENEYLKCTVLPDLGGRVYSCFDKPSKHELFYVNAVIRKYDGGLRGARITAGNDFHFPDYPAFTNTSPVDFATRQNPDGSASIFVGNTDRVRGLRWVVELLLRAGADRVEERVTLGNPTPIRRGYFWGNSAAVPSLIDSRYFGGRAPAAFHAVYSKTQDSGTMHFADPVAALQDRISKRRRDVPKADTDDGSEADWMESGTEGFLDPLETRQFVEYWMPLHQMDGVATANLQAAVGLTHGAGSVTVSVNAFERIPGAKIRLFDGTTAVLDVNAPIDPAHPFRREIASANPAAKYTFQLADEAGRPVLRYAEGLEAAPRQAAAKPPETRIERDYLDPGTSAELAGRLLAAAKIYDDALVKFADNRELNKAAGRVSVALFRYQDAIRQLESVQQRDPETHHYLGLAALFSGDEARAKAEFNVTIQDTAYGLPSRVEGAKLLARSGNLAEALKEVQSVIRARPAMAGTGGFEVALLRNLKQTDAAKASLAHWLAVDPADNLLRYEATKLGGSDDALWAHLAADPERVLDAAVVYLDAGFYAEALDLLSRKYPAPGPLETEPGSVLPQDHPMVSYYRGYCRMKMGGSGKADFAAASKQAATYIGPHRAEDQAVLHEAIKENRADAMAHYLLGALYLAGGITDLAVEEWREASKGKTKFPGLEANMVRLRDSVKDDPRMLLSATEQSALKALSLLQSNRIGEALSIFSNGGFPEGKQPETVKQAFIEARLRNILDLAHQHHCPEAQSSIEKIGDEDKAVPFSIYGFSSVLKSARVQYLLAAAQVLCGDTKTARKGWSKVAKASGSGSPIESAYGLLASWRLNPQAIPALEQALPGLQSSPYARGLLLRALGKSDEAIASFKEGMEAAGNDFFLRYLCNIAIRGSDK